MRHAPRAPVRRLEAAQEMLDNSFVIVILQSHMAAASPLFAAAAIPGSAYARTEHRAESPRSDSGPKFSPFSATFPPDSRRRLKAYPSRGYTSNVTSQATGSSQRTGVGSDETEFRIALFTALTAARTSPGLPASSFSSTTRGEERAEALQAVQAAKNDGGRDCRRAGFGVRQRIEVTVQCAQCGSIRPSRSTVAGDPLLRSCFLAGRAATASGRQLNARTTDRNPATPAPRYNRAARIAISCWLLARGAP